MKRKLLQVILSFVLVVNISTAGFDAGGGPGELAVFVLDFLASDIKKFLVGTAIKNYNDYQLTLSPFSPQKSLDNDSEAKPTPKPPFKGLVQKEDIKYLLAVVSPKHDYQEIYHLVFQYKGEIKVGDKYVFDFKNKVNVYRFKQNSNILIEINFRKFMDSLCGADGADCPDINFIVREKEE